MNSERKVLYAGEKLPREAAEAKGWFHRLKEGEYLGNRKGLLLLMEPRDQNVVDDAIGRGEELTFRARTHDFVAGEIRLHLGFVGRKPRAFRVVDTDEIIHERPHYILCICWIPPWRLESDAPLLRRALGLWEAFMTIGPSSRVQCG